MNRIQPTSRSRTWDGRSASYTNWFTRPDGHREPDGKTEQNCAIFRYAPEINEGRLLSNEAPGNEELGVAAFSLFIR